MQRQPSLPGAGPAIPPVPSVQRCAGRQISGCVETDWKKEWEERRATATASTYCPFFSGVRIPLLLPSALGARVAWCRLDTLGHPE